jgi:processing peptidase subunit beta
VERAVNAVTEQDVMNFAKSKIWDRDIAISAVGKIEGLFDYMRIRADMSRNLS